MASGLKVALVTPERKLLEEQAATVSFPMHDGQIGMLPGRAPLLCRLGAGVMALRTAAGVEHRYFIDGGFGQMRGSSLTLLADAAQPVEKLSASAAEQDLSAASKLPNLTDEQHERRQRRQDAARAKREAAEAK